MSLARSLCDGLTLEGQAVEAMRGRVFLLDALMEQSAVANAVSSWLDTPRGEAIHALVPLLGAPRDSGGEADAAAAAANRIIGEALGWASSAPRLVTLGDAGLPQVPLTAEMRSRLMGWMGQGSRDDDFVAALVSVRWVGGLASQEDMKGKAALVSRAASRDVIARVAALLAEAASEGRAREGLASKGAGSACFCVTFAMTVRESGGIGSWECTAKAGDVRSIVETAGGRVRSQLEAAEAAAAEGGATAGPGGFLGGAAGGVPSEVHVTTASTGVRCLVPLESLRGDEDDHGHRGDEALVAAALAAYAHPCSPVCLGPRVFDQPDGADFRGVNTFPPMIPDLGVVAEFGRAADAPAHEGMSGLERVTTLPRAGTALARLLRALTRHAVLQSAAAAAGTADAASREELVRHVMEPGESADDVIRASRGSDTSQMPDSLAVDTSLSIAMRLVTSGSPQAVVEATEAGLAESVALMLLVQLDALAALPRTPASAEDQQRKETNKSHAAGLLLALQGLLVANTPAAVRSRAVPDALVAVATAASVGAFGEQSASVLRGAVDSLATVGEAAGPDAIAAAVPVMAAQLSRVLSGSSHPGTLESAITALRSLMSFFRLLHDASRVDLIPDAARACLEAGVPRAAARILQGLARGSDEEAQTAPPVLTLLSLGSACLLRAAHDGAPGAREMLDAWDEGALGGEALLAEGEQAHATEADADAPAADKPDAAGADASDGGAGPGDAKGAAAGRQLATVPDAVARGILCLFRAHGLDSAHEVMGPFVFAFTAGWLASVAQRRPGLALPVLANPALAARLASVPTPDYGSARAAVPVNAAMLLAAGAAASPAVGAAVAEHTRVDALLAPILACLQPVDSESESGSPSTPETRVFLRTLAPYSARLAVAALRDGAPGSLGVQLLRQNRPGLVTVLGDGRDGLRSLMREAVTADGKVDAGAVMVASACVELLAGMTEEAELEVHLVGGGIDEVLEDAAVFFDSVAAAELAPPAAAPLFVYGLRMPGALPCLPDRLSCEATAALARRAADRISGGE